MPTINLDTGEIIELRPVIKASPLRVSDDSKQAVPDTPELSGSNGVAMPGPTDMGETYEEFDAVGADMRGVSRWHSGDSMPFAEMNADGLDHSAPSSEQGVMREGFGRGTTGGSRDTDEPTTNQDFGVASDSGNLGLGDMAANMHVYGTVGSNTEAVRAADIVGVFDAVGRGGSGGGHDGGAVEMPGQAMQGLPLGAGSGTLAKYDAPTGDADNDGY